jgi:hypothetical protein
MLSLRMLLLNHGPHYRLVIVGDVFHVFLAIRFVTGKQATYILDKDCST